MFGLPGVDGGGRPRYLPPLRNAGGAYRPTRRDPPVPENDARRPTTYAPSSRARYAFVAVEEWASRDALAAHLRQPPITDFLRDLPTARGRRDRPGAVPSGAARRPRRPRSRCTRSPAPGRCRSDNRAAAVDITRTESQQTRCSERQPWSSPCLAAAPRELEGINIKRGGVRIGRHGRCVKTSPWFANNAR